MFPYSILAGFYNDVMSHVEYERWAAYTLAVGAEYKCGINKVFDFACGTGNLVFQLELMGCDASGADGIEEMVKIANAEKVNWHSKASFYTCDFLNLPPVSNQDMVLCLYDSSNYILEVDQQELFFDQVKQLLSPDGIFLFDCSTRLNSIRHFNGYKFREVLNDTTILRYAYYTKKDNIQHNEFFILPEGEDYYWHEHHRQRIWSLRDFEKSLKKTGYKLLNKYDGFSFASGSEKSERVHFVAKPA
ncbi:class I SAM-dependent methyltransferase [bacterium]|nr:class I SAM-dependent methyltransferase [bacterium]